MRSSMQSRASFPHRKETEGVFKSCISGNHQKYASILHVVCQRKSMKQEQKHYEKKMQQIRGSQIACFLYSEEYTGRRSNNSKMASQI